MSKKQTRRLEGFAALASLGSRPVVEVAPVAEVAPVVAPVVAEVAPVVAEVAPVVAEVAPVVAEVAPVVAEVAPVVEVEEEDEWTRRQREKLEELLRRAAAPRGQEVWAAALAAGMPDPANVTAGTLAAWKPPASYRDPGRSWEYWLSDYWYHVRQKAEAEMVIQAAPAWAEFNRRFAEIRWMKAQANVVRAVRAYGGPESPGRRIQPPTPELAAFLKGCMAASAALPVGDFYPQWNAICHAGGSVQAGDEFIASWRAAEAEGERLLREARAAWFATEVGNQHRVREESDAREVEALEAEAAPYRRRSFLE
jgi:hypothetical protein